MPKLPIGTALIDRRPGAGYMGTVVEHHADPNLDAVLVAWLKWPFEKSDVARRLLNWEFSPEQFEIIAQAPAMFIVTVVWIQQGGIWRKPADRTEYLATWVQLHPDCSEAQAWQKLARSKHSPHLPDGPSLLFISVSPADGLPHLAA